VEIPVGFVHQGSAAAGLLTRAELAAVPAAAWWSEGRPLPGAKGRGGVVQAEIGGVAVVLRTYRRGGMLRRVLPDAFRSPARAFRELAALAALAARGVPVVAPVAAVARRRGLLWELRLATERVEAAVPLPAFVRDFPGLRRAAILRAAAVVGAAFDAGLRHRDLHPDNLIARRVGAAVEVRLLDLDRAEIGAPATPAARDAMLVRMARYLLRHRGALGYGLSTRDALRFLQGLGLGRGPRRAALARLGAALEGQARRRGLELPPRTAAAPIRAGRARRRP
jgi:3-deoxy-D-manno-octulosonic acid kinase